MGGGIPFGQNWERKNYAYTGNVFYNKCPK